VLGFGVEDVDIEPHFDARAIFGDKTQGTSGITECKKISEKGIRPHSQLSDDGA
jgi:hypothetical protein